MHVNHSFKFHNSSLMTLKIEKLSQRTGDKWVLRDVTLEVGGDGVFGIFGPAGAGKTTLLKAIAGLVRHNGGTVTINGSDVTGTSAAARGVTYHDGSDSPSLISVVTGRAKIGPSGVRQMESFKTVLADSRDVLLLDEPFSHIDDAAKQPCFDELKKAAENRKIIFASSDFNELTALADTLAVLVNGEIVQVGSPQEIYDHPQTTAVARLTGENNIFAARRISSSDADLPEFQTLDGSHRILAKAVKKIRLGAINQNVMLAIRPEQIALSVGASFPEDNLVKAIVSRVEFRGPTSLIHFDAHGLPLKARVFKVVGVDVGDEFMLGLPPDRILVLKD